MLKKLFSWVFIFIILSSISLQAATLVFTNAGQTGRIGPNQSQINAAYSSTNLAGQVTSNNGIQEWIVPYTGEYVIEAWGAKGADGGYGWNSSAAYRTGGFGAKVRGTFNLTAGTTLRILVGQMGIMETSYYHRPGGGGGGSFVATSSNSPLLVAGGGGGAGQNEWGQIYNGYSAETGTSGSVNGGVNGYGGSASSYNGGGGGFYGNGAGYQSFYGGSSFVNGGLGGYADSWATASHGGFGGGGAGALLPGGGGGYSGGGTAGVWASTGYAGGGGSYNAGYDTWALASGNAGQGQVFITFDEAQVPEPCSILLLAFGVIFFLKKKINR